jgi:hypothetical protein
MVAIPPLTPPKTYFNVDPFDGGGSRVVAGGAKKQKPRHAGTPLDHLP